MLMTNKDLIIPLLLIIYYRSVDSCFEWQSSMMMTTTKAIAERDEPIYVCRYDTSISFIYGIVCNLSAFYGVILFLNTVPPI